MKGTLLASGPTERLDFVDSLRGFALLGVFWANLLIFSGISYMTEKQRALLFSGALDAAAYRFERFFIENKFIGLFSILFGISFWLFISRLSQRGGPATAMFYRRIGWLFAIGLVHGGLLWCFDVLRFYALWAVLLPLFARMAPRRLLAAALCACVLVPSLVAGIQAWLPASPDSGTSFDAMALSAFSGGSYLDVLLANWKYDAYLTFSIGQIAYQVALFGRLLLGLYIVRTLDLGNPGAHRVLLKRILLAGALAGAVGSSVYAGELVANTAGSPALAFMRRAVVESGFLGMSLAFASGLALMFLSGRWKPMVRVFAPVGRMALTWYLLQTVFGVWLFYGFTGGPSLMGRVGPAALVGLTLLGFAIQLWLARVWLGRFRFGPAEWLWRTLTYGKIQTMRATSPVTVQRLS